MYRAKLFSTLLALLVLAGCAGSRGPASASAGREGHHEGDYRDASPRQEPPATAGNKSPYTVLGKTYYLLPTAEGYHEVGIASWYGTKFHGRATSNGEPYDMFAMTAAHKTLPIPTYVRVTNLDNGRSAILRVNDRGPFHDDRLIDLSYAAARKLDVLDQGTARVEVVAIDPSTYQRNSVELPRITGSAPRPVLLGPAPSALKDGPPLATAGTSSANASSTRSASSRVFLQVGSFTNLKSARSLETRLEHRVAAPATVRSTRVAGRELFRVFVGPFADTEQLHSAREMLVATERLNPLVVDGVNL